MGWTVMQKETKQEKKKWLLGVMVREIVSSLWGHTKYDMPENITRFFMV